MPLPELTVGLIVRYEYIWARRGAVADIADKDHLACVVATFRTEGTTEEFVVYLPISHTQPSGDDVGVELSAHARSVAGLDGQPQWVLVSECNIDAWPIDVRQLPRQPGRFHYGYLPPAVFKAVRDRFVEQYKVKRIRQIGRPAR